MRTGFLITARMKSTRLPRKITLKINGRELIAWMIDRLKQCTFLNEIVIATSTNPQDDILCEIAEREGIGYYRGSEEDVLERLYEATNRYEFDYMLNLTADCPLVAFDFIDQAVELYEVSNADLITGYKLPHGLYFWGIKPSALEKILEVKNDTNTEVWGRYFTDTDLFKVMDMEIPREYQRRHYRVTLDYPDDYVFFKALFNKLGKDTYKKTTRQIIDCLDRNPDIARINKHCDVLYRKRRNSQNKIILK